MNKLFSVDFQCGQLVIVVLVFFFSESYFIIAVKLVHYSTFYFLARRLCNMDIISHVQQVICFAFHDSRLLMETCQEAKNLRKIVTLFYLDWHFYPCLHIILCTRVGWERVVLIFGL